MTIAYWSDGCWVHFEDLNLMSHRDTSPCTFEVSPDTDEHTIDTLVQDLVS